MQSSNKLLRRALRVTCGFAALSAAIAAAPAAMAQDTVSDIIVTAQKRSENLQDVPVSVTALGGERLQSAFAAGDDILALSAKAPGLYAESSNGRAAPRFYIRGLGNSDFDLAASQPVSIIQDEVVLENVVLKSSPIYDIDQVEVLRGPQGTLFGRNTTAGIVKFSSVKPSEETKARAALSYGSFNTLTFDGGFGGALVPGKVAARASLLVQHRDDYINNAFTKKNDALGGFDEKAARLQVLFTPTEAMSALFNIHGRDLDGTSATFRANVLTKGSNKLNANYDRKTVYFDAGAGNPQKYKGWGTSANIGYDFGDVTLTSITAYEETHGSSRGDIDGGNLKGPGFIPFPSESTDGIKELDQVTQELRLASDTDGPLSWQVGAFYFDTSYQIRTDPGFAPVTTLEQKNTSWAVFGQASYKASEALTLTGGLRYTSDDKDMRVVSGPNKVAPVSVSDEKVSWDLSAFYEVADNVSVYGKVASGFRGPSIQGRDIAFFAPASVAQSETILSYEVGLKSELLDRRVRLNGALFTYTIDNPQFSAVGGGSNSNRLINANKAEAYGVELDAEFVVTDNLVVTAGYSYAKTEIKDSKLTTATCAQCTVTDPRTSTGLALINGNPFPNAPEYTFDVTARYAVPFGADGELFAYTDWKVQGLTNFFLYESKEFYSKGDFEGGLKLGYAKLDGAWEAAVFARNITDENNLKGAIDFNNNTAFVNEPRVIGVSLNVKM
ncbi:TonB-dependent receptor [Caulobacter henricii]|uniref:TonB-dependent receptor n=1 Tax=Caulobacter henricii TaxID=69395 RepID=A0A0P0NZU9_9CAUL|nr:TonB-dependent receptor [Caulobacter henricii]ALL13367.1 TonB-dependent receptor [Caulobacter henricii]